MGKEKIIKEKYLKPEVSVLLIAYNEEAYIEQAMESILNQRTNFPFEIICHDDASTDKTPEIIMRYVKKYPGIVVPVLQKENQVREGKRNIIVDFMYPLVKGKYVSYCDGDDYWIDPDKLQKQYDFLENHSDYNCCLHNFRFLYEENGKQKSAECGSSDREIVMGDIIPWHSKKIPQIGTAMFRLSAAHPRPELFYKIGGGKDSLRPISDMPLYVYLALNGKIMYLADEMSVWRRRLRGTWGNGAPKDRFIRFTEDEIRFYKELDAYSQYRYTDQIKLAINQLMYHICWAGGAYKKAQKYAGYVELTGKERLLLFVGSKVPGVTDTLRRGTRAVAEIRKVLGEKGKMRDEQI